MRPENFLAGQYAPILPIIVVAASMKKSFYQGTRMFSPGTRVYLGEPYRGMAAQSLHVVGLRRISREWVNCVIEIGALESLRIATIYSTSLWTRLDKLNAQRFVSKDAAEVELAYLDQAWLDDAPEKIKSKFYRDPEGSE